jgi:acyl-CoA synthetase (AMP-forming)/AMP-acid ligase II
MPLPPDRPHLDSLISNLEPLGEKLAVVERRGFRMQRTPYRELARLAARCACELESRGITKGQRVVICGTNGSDWIGSFFGCILRGEFADSPYYPEKESALEIRIAVNDVIYAMTH